MDIFGSIKACLRSHSHSELTGALAKVVKVQFLASFLAVFEISNPPLPTFFPVVLCLL